jgi:hypothetical protein
MIIGLPLARLIERLKIGRWWSYLAFATATGALLGAIFSSHPGFAGENPPIQWNDYRGTIAFGAVIGGVLGISFWFFYWRRKKP